MTESRFPNLEAVREGFRRYAERNTVCRAPGCRCGFVAPDPYDIDSFTGEPRRVHCTACKGKGFVPRQMELPL